MLAAARPCPILQREQARPDDFVDERGRAREGEEQQERAATHGVRIRAKSVAAARSGPGPIERESLVAGQQFEVEGVDRQRLQLRRDEAIVDDHISDIGVLDEGLRLLAERVDLGVGQVRPSLISTSDPISGNRRVIAARRRDDTRER